MTRAIKLIRLYVKTHNNTGLKYFGKTIREDVQAYTGSGTRWLNHLQKHGYDVTTEVIGIFEDEDVARQVAIDFSIEHDIVNSPLWANLKFETLDGGWDHITAEHIQQGIATFRSRPPEEQHRANKKKAQPGSKNFWYGKDRSGANNPRFGASVNNEQRERQRAKMTGFVTAVDIDGNRMRVPVDDPRYVSGQLVAVAKRGHVVVRNAAGHTLSVAKDDPRLKTGELVHVNCGKKRSAAEKQHLAAKVSATKWWTNGITTVRAPSCPGEEWKPGRGKLRK